MNEKLFLLGKIFNEKVWFTYWTDKYTNIFYYGMAVSIQANELSDYLMKMPYYIKKTVLAGVK